MSLNIKNPEAHTLAARLAEKTGETMTQAVLAALRERLARLEPPAEREARIERLRAISRECAPLWKEPYKSMEHGDLLYDDMGLPK